MSPDLFNATFEAVGATAIMLNVRATWRDKHVAGVRWWTTGFFAAWGLWNLFYYPHLGQWFSFTAGVYMVVANLLWVASLIQFSGPKPVELIRAKLRLEQIEIREVQGHALPHPECSAGCGRRMYVVLVDWRDHEAERYLSEPTVLNSLHDPLRLNWFPSDRIRMWRQVPTNDEQWSEAE